MNPYFRSLKYVRPYWNILSLGLIFTIILFIISLVPPFFTKILIDRVFMEKNVELLNILFIGIIVIFFFDLILGLANHYIFVKIGQRISFDVRTHFFQHLQKLSMRFYDSRRSGDLIYRLFGDTESIPGAVSSTMVDFLLHLVTLIVVSVILINLNWKLSLFCFLIIPLHAVSLIVFRKPIIKWSQRLRQIDEKISGNVVEYFSSIRIVKAFSKEESEAQRFREEQDERMQLGLKSNLINKISNLVTGSINNFLFFLVLWYGGYDVIRENITLGDLMAFLVLVGRLYMPVSGIAGIILGLQDSMVGMNRLYDILDLPVEENEVTIDRDKPQLLPEIKGYIEFRNVSFSYNGIAPVLQDVSFSIKPKERISLVGKSGVGKTTLINLLARFYEPREGIILVDDHDIRDLSLLNLRKHMGIVLQDAYLFSGSIKDNILYGNPDATDEEVSMAAKNANAHEFIETLPEKYDTHIGERGIRLSGGQKQRIAIARAFLKDSAILILDEAMSSVDLESEFLIQDALNNLMRERTSIVIAHRLSTIRNSDRILVLNDGIIAEQGIHSELMMEKGLYYQMYERLSII